ncbi:alpha-2-macroglobulin family protein [Raineya orbicola]|uniref:MG2 domain n=1 Tax=Raineya orbicola TaxID=2016530 RepID=A0A2N3I835_9BACT|nr:alpha-2-macroglobulin family protein [Raineya orbicola]PKQ66459.1 MG2 domain [Raineya orbicola]
MKKFILSLAIFIAMVQTNQAQTMYENLWKKVNEAESKGLPETARKSVEEIYAQAKKDKNNAQLVKAVIYRLKYYEVKEEKDVVKALMELKKEAEKAEFPTKNLLYSMQAEIFWKYYQENRWRFADRTQMQENPEDIETWSIAKITEETRKHFLLSLEKPNELQKVQINVFDEVLHKGTKEARALRPTLYDFLAWRAVNFFQSQEAQITRPAYYFQLDKPEYFAPAPEFIKLNLQSKDEDSFDYQALKIYQELLKINVNSSKNAYLHIDLTRLSFVYNNAVLPQKEELYEAALEKMKATYAESEEVSFVYHALATLYYQKGLKYNPEKGNQFQMELKKAYQICEEAIKKFPNTNGTIICENLKNTILTKEIALQMEQTEPSNTAFKALLIYRNFDKLHYRIFKVDRSEIKQKRREQRKDYTDYQERKFLAFFLNKKPIKTGTFDLPNLQDYQKHRTEIAFEGLPVGDYMLIVSEKNNFTLESNNAVAYNFFTISDIAYIHKNLPDGKTDLYVLHRKTGEPLPKVQVEAFGYRYNSALGEYERVPKGKFQTNAQGFVSLPYLNSAYRSYYEGNLDLDFKLASDFLSTQEIDSDRYYSTGTLYQDVYEAPSEQWKTLFFLDRAIYRPGQTIYFKGMVLTYKGKSCEIVPNYSVNVTFYDVNHQAVEVKNFVTNEYGTFNGFFTAPKNGITGQMSLVSNIGGKVYFSVEEYKRPKFEVKFEPVKQAYRVNEEVTAIGKAQAYSGANIDNAQVKYRVVRKAEFPIWWWRWYGYYPESPEIEIANGTTKTDENGNFKINFKAIPDLSVDKNAEPIFNYEVYADVTDLNGETRGNQTNIRVGYKALQIGTSLTDINQDEWKNQPIKIETLNLMGEFEPAQGEIHIYKLKTPSKVFKKRLWAKPDVHTLSKADFERMFPEEAYQNEDNKAFWEKDKSVFNLAFNTRDKKEFELKDMPQWQQGVYLIEMVASDKYGQEVRSRNYFEVFSDKAKIPAIPTNLFAKTLKATYEVGENAQILVGTSLSQKVLYEIAYDKEIAVSKWLNLKNEQIIQNLPVSEKLKGGFFVTCTSIYNNRLYQEQKFVDVPYSEKELEVIFETYRNKLLPGEQEEWRLRIKGKKADKIAAEMVATLYDASLDAFRVNEWGATFWDKNYLFANWQSLTGFKIDNFRIQQYAWNSSKGYFSYDYDDLNWFGYTFYYYYARQRERGVTYKSAVPAASMKERNGDKEDAPLMEVASFGVEKREITGKKLDSSSQNKQEKLSQKNTDDIQIRKNFNETAFFYPELRTNEKGEIIVKFTVPEALTRWKMLGFVHTKELAYAFAKNTLVTQKDLMVVPNQPRFYRENDEMVFAVKVTSLAETELKGEAQLEFFDAISNKKINLTQEARQFVVKPGASQNLEWKIRIPEGLQALTYRVVAKSGKFSDGEEMTLPVVTNRMLVTETMPLPIRGKQEKNFKFEKLLTSGSSNTLKHQRFTLEFTSNPAWYAVQALPYMMEYPYECVEQTFSRYYANSIATHVANSNPKIKQVFDTWKNYQPDALLSNLEKNQELKAALLEETPWVLNAKDESQRKRQVALLFDLNRMANEQEAALEKVRRHQLESGGFTWFLGFPEDRYMTQHIIAQMGHLDVMKVKSIREDDATWQMLQKAIAYTDRMIADDYAKLKVCVARGQCKFENNNLSYLQIQYLYARSYFKDIAIPNASKEAFNYYLGQAKKFWLSYPLYTEGMLCLALDRFGDKQTPQAMIKSFSEKALHSEEFGMYWKQERSWWWYQAPIETQALMIEVYDEVAKNQKAVEDLKVWLLKQKQTQDWKTTRATAEACYALLRRGSDALASEQLVEVSLGGEVVRPSEATETKVEAGTGYFKTAWNAEQVRPEMGNIKVTKKDEGVAWGAVYWQYFEQLDKITFAETPISIKKDLFLEKDSDKGKILVPITEKNPIKVGDLVKVRIEIRVDRDMEYVHLKDMRAAGFEPTNVLSGYRYQDGMWYYESTRDMATNFFISYLRKGTYVFEYPLRASLKGDYSNGITTIQCMYAPEFTSHSAGIRVKIE